jgi:hypothetical protein
VALSEAVMVRTKVLCFSKKSGSGQAARTQSIGQLMETMLYLYDIRFVCWR